MFKKLEGRLNKVQSHLKGRRHIQTSIPTPQPDLFPDPTTMSIPYTPHTLVSPSARVHLEYDPADIPPIPSTSADGEPCQWTRFVCISDTHARRFPVPPGDVLLHSGDLTNTGKVKEFRTTMEWLYGLPHPVKM